MSTVTLDSAFTSNLLPMHGTLQTQVGDCIFKKGYFWTQVVACFTWFFHFHVLVFRPNFSTAGQTLYRKTTSPRDSSYFKLLIHSIASNFTWLSPFKTHLQFSPKAWWNLFSSDSYWILNQCQWSFFEELVEDLEQLKHGGTFINSAYIVCVDFQHFSTVLIFFESC
jgi:hypothetical protein